MASNLTPGEPQDGSAHRTPESQSVPFSAVVAAWAKRALAPVDAGAVWAYRKWRGWYERRYDESKVSKAPRLQAFVSESFEGWKRFAQWVRQPVAVRRMLDSRVADRLRTEARDYLEWNLGQARPHVDRLRPYAAQAWSAMTDYWNSPSRDFAFSWKRTGDVLSGRKFFRLDRGAALRIGLYLSMAAFLLVREIRQPLLRDLTGIACFHIWHAGPEAMPERDVRLIKMKCAHHFRDGLREHYDTDKDGVISGAEEARLVSEAGLTLEELTRKGPDVRLGRLLAGIYNERSAPDEDKAGYDADQDGRFDEAELHQMLERMGLTSLREKHAAADLLELANAGLTAEHASNYKEDGDYVLPAGLALDPAPPAWGDAQLLSLVKAAHRAGILAEIATRYQMTPRYYVFDDDEDPGEIHELIAKTAWLRAQQPYEEFREQTWAEINKHLRMRWRPAEDYFKSEGQRRYERFGVVQWGGEIPKDPRENTTTEKVANLAALVKREGFDKFIQVVPWVCFCYAAGTADETYDIPPRYTLIRIPKHLEWPTSLEGAVEEPAWIIETGKAPAEDGRLLLQANRYLSAAGDSGGSRALY